MSNLILPDVWETREIKASELDPCNQGIREQANRLFESLRCHHQIDEFSRKCVLCGDSELEIYRRIKKDINPTYIDTYKNGFFLFRETKKEAAVFN